jgi:hypothetical protein
MSTNTYDYNIALSSDLQNSLQIDKILPYMLIPMERRIETVIFPELFFTEFLKYLF